MDGLELPVDAAQVPGGQQGEGQQGQQLAGPGVVPAGVAQAHRHGQAHVVCYHLLSLQVMNRHQCGSCETLLVLMACQRRMKLFPPFQFVCDIAGVDAYQSRANFLHYHSVCVKLLMLMAF